MSSGAVTLMKDFPLAPRGTRWDCEAAEAAIRGTTGAEDPPNAAYADCFFRHDPAASDRYGSYKLLYCDGARGGTTIPPADQAEINTVVAGWYAKMAAAFDDSSIVPSWSARRS
jgi:hypothetical protein